MPWMNTGPRRVGPLHETDLKICDLCGALNLSDNASCCVCTWHGRFERRPEVVRMAMDLMVRRHGSLDLSLLTDPTPYRPVLKDTFRTRCIAFFSRLTSRFRR